MTRRLLAFLLAFLLLSMSSRARDDSVGLISGASGARIASGLVSAGATIFDGDCLSTAEEGFVNLRSGSSRIYLFGQSTATLHGTPKSLKAELAAGSLAFSTTLAEAVTVQADGAMIRPSADAPTSAHVRILGPANLLITARSGALQFSYHGESQVLEEGHTYRIALDLSAAPSAGASAGDNPTHQGGREGKFFKIVFISAVAVAVGVTIWAIHEAPESPDRP